MSGLVVGYELGSLGYDYHILEARDRVGGLAWTVRRGSEHTEIGGERQVCRFDEALHQRRPLANPVYAYRRAELLQRARRADGAVRQRGRERLFLLREQAAGPLAGKRVRLREVKADMIGHTNELIVKAIDQHQLDLPLTAEDRERFVTYLTAHGYLDAKSAPTGAFETRGAGDPLRRSCAAAGRFRQPAAFDRRTLAARRPD